MSNRRLRGDSRAGHHDGVDRDPAHQPGPVRALDPETLEPRRINVVEVDEAAARAALEAAAALSFDEQKEQVRRLNAMLLARVGARIESGAGLIDESAALLQRCSAIAKQWATEERQSKDSKTDDPNDVEALKRAAKRSV